MVVRDGRRRLGSRGALRRGRRRGVSQCSNGKDDEILCCAAFAMYSRELYIEQDEKELETVHESLLHMDSQSNSKLNSLRTISYLSLYSRVCLFTPSFRFFLG
jgi:hypothetical protein